MLKVSYGGLVGYSGMYMHAEMTDSMITRHLDFVRRSQRGLNAVDHDVYNEV
jgi:hypothetical protein